MELSAKGPAVEVAFEPLFLLCGLVQSFEIGSGIEGSRMTGSEHNDEFYMEDGRVRTRTNRSGGVQVSKWDKTARGTRWVVQVSFVYRNACESVCRSAEHTDEVSGVRLRLMMLIPLGWFFALEETQSHGPCPWYCAIN